MSKSENQVPKKVVEPLYFDNINMNIDPNTIIDGGSGLPVLFMNPDGSNEKNMIFNSPNAYDYVLDVNRVLYASRERLNQMMRGQGINRSKSGIDIDSAEFYNKQLSTNIVWKMLDEIEYNCNIVCANGMYNLIKDFLIKEPSQEFDPYTNDIRSILNFKYIRRVFNHAWLRCSYDEIGEFVIFEVNGENEFRYSKDRRPVYCRDNNVLNTMLNLKQNIISLLAYNYGGFINFVINSGYYDISAMCKSLAPNEKNLLGGGVEYSFITGCLNEQGQRDISKMGDMIEIAVISALHNFLNNVVFIDYDPVPISKLPGVKNYKKLSDGTEIAEF